MLHTFFATRIQQCIAKPGFCLAKSGFCLANCDAIPGKLCPGEKRVICRSSLVIVTRRSLTEICLDFRKQKPTSSLSSIFIV